MADKTVTVRPSGGDYTSLQAAITGEVTANANLVTGLDGILTIQIEGDWSGGPDTTLVNVTGFTTDADHYVKIVTDKDNRAGTARDAGKYRLAASSNQGTLNLNQAYTRVTGLQVRDTTGNGQSAIEIYADDCIIDSCFVYDSGWHGIRVYQAENTVIVNSIVVNSSRNGFLLYQSLSILYNCTSAGNGGGGFTIVNNAVIKNCYSGGNSTDYLVSAGGFTKTTCFSSDGTESTTEVDYDTTTFANVTAGSEDFALVSGSDLIGAGTDLSSDATYPFDWDITGATRSSWDVGAAEFVASGVELEGSVTCTSTAVGAITVARALAGSVPAESTVAGALTVGKALAGTVVAESTVSGTLAGGVALAGSVACVSTVAGAITTGRALSGSVVAESTATGAITTGKLLSGSVAATSTTEGALTVARLLAGLVACESAATGDLTVGSSLNGRVVCESLTQGALTVGRALAGSVQAQSTVTGQLASDINLAGLVACVSTVTGRLGAQIKLASLGISAKVQSIGMTGKVDQSGITAKVQSIGIGGQV
jgi:hypothetical protein